MSDRVIVFGRGFEAPPLDVKHVDIVDGVFYLSNEKDETLAVFPRESVYGIYRETAVAN